MLGDIELHVANFALPLCRHIKRMSFSKTDEPLLRVYLYIHSRLLWHDQHTPSARNAQQFGMCDATM